MLDKIIENKVGGGTEKTAKENTKESTSETATTAQTKSKSATAQGTPNVQADPIITYLSLVSAHHTSKLDRTYAESVFDSFSI